MNRSGKRSAKKLTMVDSVRSPTRTTMRGSCSPRATSARPKTSRVFFISTFWGSVMVAVTSVSQQPRGPLGVRGAELLEGGLRLVRLGGFPVPVIIVGHVRDSLAHHGVGQNHARLAAVRPRRGESAQDVVHVVTVALDRVPAER